jgi:outer membrane murein-binding lipoprotein Lpp
MSDAYNATVLDEELRAAGLAIVGCSSKGRIDWASPPTAADAARAEQVKAAHDPAKPPAREARLEALRAKRRAREPLTDAEKQDALDLFLGV